MKKVYLRRSSGQGIEIKHISPQPLIHYLPMLSIFPNNKNLVKAVCNDEMINLEKNIQENKLKDGSIVHISAVDTEENQSTEGNLYIYFNRQLYKISFSKHTVVKELKKQISQVCGISPEDQMLVCKGQSLYDDLTLVEYGIRNQDCISLIEVKKEKMEITHTKYRKSFSHNQTSSDKFIPFFQKSANTRDQEKSKPLKDKQVEIYGIDMESEEEAPEEPEELFEHHEEVNFPWFNHKINSLDETDTFDIELVKSMSIKDGEGSTKNIPHITKSYQIKLINKEGHNAYFLNFSESNSLSDIKQLIMNLESKEEKVNVDIFNIEKQKQIASKEQLIASINELSIPQFQIKFKAQ